MSIEALLQSHNELLLALHKSFVESMGSINKNLEKTLDELDKLKSQVNQIAVGRSAGSDQSVGSWRSHAEHILDLQDKQHQREVERLVEALKMTSVQVPKVKHTTADSSTPRVVQQQQQQIRFNPQPPIPPTFEQPSRVVFQPPILPAPVQPKPPIRSMFQPTSRDSQSTNLVAVQQQQPLQASTSRQESTKQGVDEANKDADENEEADDFVPNVHFEPVIPLPALVDVKTGEEDEDVLLTTRCKLYRYDKELKENKERGLGEIKVLKNKATGKCRVVMRRDQTLKVCANFPVHGGIKVTAKPNFPTVYTWACKDFSEEVEGVDEIFLARFKDAENAVGFYQKMREIIDNTSA